VPSSSPSQKWLRLKFAAFLVMPEEKSPRAQVVDGAVV